MGKLYHMPCRGAEKTRAADPKVFAFRSPGAPCPFCGSDRVDGNLHSWCVTPCHGQKAGSIVFEKPDRTIYFKGCVIKDRPHVHCHSVCCGGSWVMQRACDVPPLPSAPERLRMWLGIPPSSPDSLPQFHVYILGVVVGSLLTLFGLWALGLFSFS